MAMDDPYKLLGVERTATADQIRAAYRKLAKKLHPDLNPGKADLEARFKAINAANDILSDPERRARFDRGEIDASGAEKPPEHAYYRDFADGGGRAKYRAEHGIDPEDLEAMFAQAFGGRGGFGGGGPGMGAGGREFRMRGGDARYALAVPFLDAINGAKKRLTMPDGRTLDVNVPAGVEDGQIMRLKGQGMPGFGGGPAGDALIEISVEPHPLFRREGDDVHVELPVTLAEAVLGGKVEAPTPGGPVTLSVPANATSGTRLRLKGRGVKGGHLYVTLTVMTPEHDEPELAEFLKTWKPRRPQEPRKGIAS
jgi:DnaJ-class molecular chaperone